MGAVATPRVRRLFKPSYTTSGYISVGSRITHYDVTALIGEGGMGQVYQATDTKLNRQVALKILPEAFATDPDRLARFEREALVWSQRLRP